MWVIRVKVGVRVGIKVRVRRGCVLGYDWY